MTLIDYPTFLANVQTADLAMLTTFVVGVPVNATAGDSAGADALFAQAQRLASYGMLTSLSRNYAYDSNGNLLQSFVGVVSPPAAGYLSQLARERVTLSRAVLP